MANKLEGSTTNECLPTFELRRDKGNNRFSLIRNKFPRFKIEIKDSCDLKQLSDALKAAGEFLLKYQNIYGRNQR